MLSTSPWPQRLPQSIIRLGNLQRLLRFDLECSGDRAALKAPAAKQNGYSLSSACITAAGFMFEVGCIFLSPVVFVFS